MNDHLKDRTKFQLHLNSPGPGPQFHSILEPGLDRQEVQISRLCKQHAQDLLQELHLPSNLARNLQFGCQLIILSHLNH